MVVVRVFCDDFCSARPTSMNAYAATVRCNEQGVCIAAVNSIVVAALTSTVRWIWFWCSNRCLTEFLVGSRHRA